MTIGVIQQHPIHCFRISTNVNESTIHFRALFSFKGLPGVYSSKPIATLKSQPCRSTVSLKSLAKLADSDSMRAQSL